MAEMDFFDRLQTITETALTNRKCKKRIKKEKSKNKNVILDWLEAFLWAAGVVLLINQYLFQAYQIPSGSMIDTLLIGDRIFVNKIIFGPEILPGWGKLPSPIKPKRNDIIIFENPSYESQSMVFNIAQRIIFMLTLSFVDIDRDESGEPKAHFLIKRAVGMGGDRFVMDKGNMKIRFAGETRWIDESEFNSSKGYNHKVSRLIDAAYYPALEARGRAMALREMGLQVPGELLSEESRANFLSFPDNQAIDKSRRETLRTANPHNETHRNILARYNLGWYVPENRILPLGDNRDNSRDGRYFGPVRSDRILGKGSMIHWPISRIGMIK